MARVYDDERQDEDLAPKGEGYFAYRKRQLREREQRAKEFQEFLNDPNATEAPEGERSGISKKLKDRADKLRQGEENPYKYTGKKGDEEDDRKQRKGKRRRRRGVIFGSIGGAGLIGGMGLFSMTLGPLQFMNLSNMLGDHDFGAQEDSDDDRVSRLIRYVRFASQGQSERTRLGYLGNKYADKYEAKLRGTGWKSGYSAAYGFFDGYVIDRDAPEYRGLNDEELARHIEDKEGLTPKRGSDYPGNIGFADKDFVIPASDLGTYKGRKFTQNRLKEAGVGRISSAIGARLLQKRGGGTSLFHPIKKLDEKLLRQIDVIYAKWKERRLRNIRGERVTISIGESRDREGANDSDRANAASNEAAASEIEADAAEADRQVAAGDEGAVARFRASLTGKVVGGGAAAAGVAALPCMLKAVADQATELTEKTIIAPLKRLFIEWVALGGQAGSGVDTTLEQMKPYHDLTTGTNERGERVSLMDADIISQVYTGNTARGNPPDETLLSIGKGTPFDFLNSPANKAILDAVCSTEASAAGIALSFVTGPISTAVGTLASYIGAPYIMDAAAGWLSGNPVNLFPKDPTELGNDLGFGGPLAANDFAAATGGTAMSSAAAKKLQEFTDSARLEEFQNKSLAYRLFNPRDYRTPVAKFIQRQDTQDISFNLANITGSLLDVTNSFSSTLLNIFSGRSHAATQYYEYPFPRVGFDADTLNDSRFVNPYENASKAAAIFDQPAGQELRERAKRCMGVDIAKGGDGLWNVTSASGSSPKIGAYKADECRDTGQAWLRTRFFVKDMSAGNTLACNEGEKRACEDAGFSLASAPSQAVGVVGGDAREIAKQILASPKIKFQVEPDQRNAFQTITVDGRQIAGTTKNGFCGSVAISPILLSVILSVSQQYDQLVIGVVANGHDCDNGMHPKGMAVDINGVTKGNVSTGNQLHIRELNAVQKTLVKQLVVDFANAMPPNTGWIGQRQCWDGNPPTVKQGVVLGDDTCDHLHVDVRKN